MIKGKPDVSAFLDGAAVETPRAAAAGPAAAAAAAAAKQDAASKPKAAKHQKLLELPAPVYLALKDRAYEEFKRTGTRVTETQIIIDALKAHLGLE